MTQEQIKEVEKYNEWILKCLSKYPVETHFNRMLGNHAKTIWVVYDDFEIGIIPFGGSIQFGVQIKREGHRRYYNETYLPFPPNLSHYFSKSIRWTLDMLVGKLKAQFTRPNYSRERINLTGGVLDLLGFGEYWDSNGDYGTRTLKFSNGEVVTIVEQCENEDDSFGYAADGQFIPNHYWYNGSFNTPSKKGVFNLYFLDDLFFVIDRLYPNCKPEFVAKVIDLKMGHGIDLKNDKLKISKVGHRPGKGWLAMTDEGNVFDASKTEERIEELRVEYREDKDNPIKGTYGVFPVKDVEFPKSKENNPLSNYFMGVDPANIGDNLEAYHPRFNPSDVNRKSFDFAKEVMKIRPYFNSPIMEENDWDTITGMTKERALLTLKSIRDNYRQIKKMDNAKLVERHITNMTGKNGRGSCTYYCLYLGIDPYGFKID